MESVNLLHDLAMIMMVAGVAALVCHHVRLPKLMGYIAAGVIIGPHTRGWHLVSDQNLIAALADLGIVFLLFSLGLEFNLRKLRRVGAAAVIIGVVDVALMTWLGYECGRALGWAPLPSLFLGAIISDSSTTVLAKVLTELGWSRERFATTLFGATLVEDVLAIAMIAVLTGIARGGVDMEALGTQFGLLWVFLVLVIVPGILLVPRLLLHVVRIDSGELLLLVVLALCFAISLLAVHLGFSVALGAFVIGAVAAESRITGRIEMLMAPLRQMFGAVFFVAIGLMVNPPLLLENVPLIVLLTILLVLGKTTACFSAASLMGSSGRDAFRTGIGMAQVCEFSLIIGALGQALGVTPPGFLTVAVGVCVLSTLLNPLLLRRAETMHALGCRLLPGRLQHAFRLYTHWLEHAAQHASSGAIRRIVFRCVWIVLVNLACISGVFMFAAYLAGRWDLAALPGLRLWPGGNAAIYWLAATLASLPLFIATAMKLRALGMILAELSLPFWGRLPMGMQLRNLVAGVFFFAGLAGVLLFTFILSAAFLMSWGTMLQQLLVVILVLAIGWQRLLKLYSRAQITLRENFARDLPEPTPNSFSATVGALLDMDMFVVTVAATGPLAGVPLRDTQLRSRFGVTVVNVERAGKLIPNPEPSLRLETGDRLLLLGSDEQLRHVALALGTEGTAPR